ncbi:hypothetical protein [Cupriavidus sp. TMH.W2]|uniref:hypothetical protein n=1 Tax=Cupriavidus sp. TMH.W2 TaxID=3434465 RepID=UPI003D781E11
MSLSLTLVFDKYRRDHDPIIASNRIKFEGDAVSLREALKPVTLPLPTGVEWLTEDVGLKLFKTDPYDDELTFVSAGLLAQRLNEAAQGAWGKAVAEFVQALPPDSRVVLWWH